MIFTLKFARGRTTKSGKGVEHPFYKFTMPVAQQCSLRVAIFPRATESTKVCKRAWVLNTSYGCGSKLNRRGYAGVGPCFHLPGFHFGTGFLEQPYVIPGPLIDTQLEASKAKPFVAPAGTPAGPMPLRARAPGGSWAQLTPPVVLVAVLGSCVRGWGIPG